MSYAATLSGASRIGLLSSAAGLAFSMMLSAPALADTPDKCTGADFAGITAGVASAISSYLFAHPDVNDYVTGLEAGPRSESASQLVDYESTHPTVRAELAAIRQPIVDFDARCGYGAQANPV